MRTSWLMRAAAAGRLAVVEKGDRRAERSWAGIAARARAQRRGRAMVGGVNGWREGGSQLVQCSLNECRRGLAPPPIHPSRRRGRWPCSYDAIAVVPTALIPTNSAATPPTTHAFLHPSPTPLYPVI